MIELARRLILGAGLACLAGAGAGCTHRVKPQPPQPPVVEPPPAGPVTITSGLWRPAGTGVTIDGKPARVVFRANCCVDLGTPPMPPLGWPLWTIEGIDQAYEESGGKLNLIELRPGPFLSAAELNFKAWGHGPYLERDGKADLTAFDPEFTKRVDDLVIHAGQKGISVVVALNDFWWCKQPESPWRADRNVQGIDAASTCASELTPAGLAWYDHWLKALGRHHNVLWLDGNEPKPTGNYRPGFTLELQAHARKREAEWSLPVHMFGSNGESDEVYCGVDFLVFHDNHSYPSQPVCGRPTWNLEANPSPGFTASTHLAFARAAEAAGTVWGYWRGETTDEEWSKLWRAVKSGEAEQASSCSLPRLPDLSKLSWWMDCSRQQSCDATPFIRGDHDHCVTVGMGTWEETGEWRFDCPLANEGDPRRLPCEQWAMKRWAPKWLSDGTVELVDDAGFRARTTGSWLKACDESEAHCSQKVEAP